MAWQAELVQQGYCVIPGIIPEELVSLWKGQLHQWAHDILGDTKHWFLSTHGIVKHYHVAHLRCVWEARQYLPVVDLFTQVYHCSPMDLLVSMDAINWTQPKPRSSVLVPHTDQGEHRRGKECCFQGFVCLEGGTRDSAFVCYPGSHRIHQELYDMFEPEGTRRNWWKLEGEPLEYVESLFPRLTVPAEPGSVTIWDSRLIHANVAGNAPRLGFYISYQPREWCSSRNLQKRIHYFEEGRTTTHWSALDVRVEPLKPRDYGVEKLRYLLDRTDLYWKDHLPQLSLLGRRLVGYDQ